MLQPADFFRLPAAKYHFIQVFDVQSSVHLVNQYVARVMSLFDKRVTEGEVLKGAGGAGGSEGWCAGKHHVAHIYFLKIGRKMFTS